MAKEALFLIVDDEQEVCNFFSYLLKQKGYGVETATSGAEASVKLQQHNFDTALVDLKLPDANGLDILREIKESQPHCEVIIITGFSTVKSAVEAIQLGAFDYVEKPFVDINEMEVLLERSLNVKAETEKMSAVQQELGFIVGQHPKMLSLIAAAQKIAKKNITVLIQGETGTGKEVLARYIHSVSHRSDRPFLAFNCGAFTETLLESELFGHVRGAFTGAVGNRIGRFEAAHTGTIFLDEINSTTPKLQVKLLRVLQEHEFERVGDTETIRVDTRVIAASNRDLFAEVEADRFREDLYYRLNVITIYVPPLRERKEDIPALVHHFMRIYNEENRCHVPHIRPEAMERLKEYSWPGNVRELQNYIERAVVLATGDELTVDLLPHAVLGKQSPRIGAALDLESLAQRLVQQGIEEAGPDADNLYAQIVSRTEKELICQVMLACDRIQVKAAARLGINRNTLHKKLIQLGLEDR